MTLPPVTLTSSWDDLLGFPIPPATRRQRWQAWLQLAPNDMVKSWTDTRACNDCRHLDGHWCQYAHLPCTTNPILTFRHGVIGMACMGLGKETKRQPTNRAI
jgi:hypothetical protein